MGRRRERDEGRMRVHGDWRGGGEVKEEWRTADQQDRKVRRRKQG